MLRSSPHVLSRRRFLAVTSGSVGLMLASGCAVPALEKAPDPVLDLVLAAERDAREFALADASHGKYVDSIKRIAEVRQIQAERLEELLDQPRDPDQATPTGTEEATPTCPPVEEIRSRLRTDAANATTVALDSEGIRAELTGAVSASCISAVEVLLP